ncbi:MAG: MucB/RseB C-terminal domain-containing protein [Halioglobus sp.]|nr:MucB/RseB C-terminal domain-containing protein [Halioglobus sp.]
MLINPRIPALVCAVVLLAVGTRALAEACPDADAAALAWLDKMSRSLHEVSYHGVITLQRGDDMQVIQVSHRVDDAAASETLTRLTGQGAQVDRTAHPLECVHPGHRLLRLGSELQAGHCGIAEQYRFSVGADARVAGRTAVLIQIAPRDMYRFGYSMALDRETGLLLRSETLGRGNNPLETFQFSRVVFDAEAPVAAAELVHRAEHPHPDEASRRGAVSRPWQVTWLPGGFTATDSPAALAARRTFTDGLAVMSVFLEELGRELRPGEGLVREGGTTSYTRGMLLGGQPVLITVIGEVPVNTARMVADSVEWMQ